MYAHCAASEMSLECPCLSNSDIYAQNCINAVCRNPIGIYCLAFDLCQDLFAVHFGLKANAGEQIVDTSVSRQQPMFSLQCDNNFSRSVFAVTFRRIGWCMWRLCCTIGVCWVLIPGRGTNQYWSAITFMVSNRWLGLTGPFIRLDTWECKPNWS